MANVRVTGSAATGAVHYPDAVVQMNRPFDFHVPVMAMVHGDEVSGAIEVTMGSHDRSCVADYAAVFDNPVTPTSAA